MNDTNEVRRSGPDVPIALGMVVAWTRWETDKAITNPGPTNGPREIKSLDSKYGVHSEGTVCKSLWDAGCYDILSWAQGYCATGPIADAPKDVPPLKVGDVVLLGPDERTVTAAETFLGFDDGSTFAWEYVRHRLDVGAWKIVPPVKCKGAPCGERYDEQRYRDMGSPVMFWSPGRDCLYCSPECRDRAAKPTQMCLMCRSPMNRPGHDICEPCINAAADRLAARLRETAPTKAPAPWKCADRECTTPLAPRNINIPRDMADLVVGPSPYCIVCVDRAQEKTMGTVALTESKRREHRVAAIASLASHLEPGTASALAASGASAWRPKHHGMFLIDPIDEV
jgi:hypothetical protein